MTEKSEIPNLVALVPMRHISERVPGKNYRPFVGKPLFTYILDTLQQCPEIEQIVVDTDSPIIRDRIEKKFPAIILLDRPEELRGGDVPMNEVLAHDIGEVPAAFYLQTHSTNPLLKAETISEAITEFVANYPEHDTLFSVTSMQARLWDEHGKPINHDPSILLKTQDLPSVYFENSCLYIFEREKFIASGNRIGGHPFMFEIGLDEAHDIDTEHDFEIAATMMASREL